MKRQVDGRQRRAVLITATPGEGQVEIRIDDVQSDGIKPDSWLQTVHVTSKKFERESLRTMKLDDKELADFGFYVLSRLSVFVDRDES